MYKCAPTFSSARRGKAKVVLLLLSAFGVISAGGQSGLVIANTVTVNGSPGTSTTTSGGQAIAVANATTDASHTAHAYGGSAFDSGAGGYAHATATDGATGSFSPSAGSYTVSLGGAAGIDASNTGASAVSTSSTSNSAGKATATGYSRGGSGSASYGPSNVSAANGGNGGSSNTSATASTSGANGAYATAVAQGGAGGLFDSIFTPPANSGLGGSSQASASATAAGSGTAQVYGISYGGSGGTFAGSNGNGVGGNGGAGSLGTVSASSNGGYVFVEGAEIGGAGGGFSHGGGTVTGGGGADVSLTNAVSGTTSGHSELIQISEGGAGGGGSGSGTAGAAGAGYSSLTSNITSGAVNNAGIEAYASGGAGGYFDALSGTHGTGSTGGAATSVGTGANNTGASGVAAYSIAGIGGLGVTGATSGMGGAANATATSSTTLVGGAVTAIGYAVGGNGGGTAATSSDAAGGSAIAKATANLAGGYVNAYAQAVGGTPGNGTAGVDNSATALADAYAKGAGAGAVNAQAGMMDSYNGQSANIQSNFPVTLDGPQLHTESYINAGQAPRAISAAAGANVATLLTQDPTNALVTSVLAANPQAAQNWNIGGANTSQPASSVADYNQISFISAGTSSGTSQYHSSLTVTTANVNLSTSHDAIMSFLGGTSTGSGSVIIQVTNLENHNTLLLNNGYGTLALADAATSNTTFDLGSISSLVSSSNALSLQFDMYLFTTDASAGFQTSFIFGSSVMGSGPSGGPLLSTTNFMRSSATRFRAMEAIRSAPVPEPAALVLLALGTLGLLLKPRRSAARVRTPW